MIQDHRFFASRLGWKIFPVTKNQAKPPLVKSWEQIATNDPDQIKAWETRFPGCNWAVATGPSGICILDVDKKHGKDGRRTLTSLALDGDDIPHTRTHRTPTGGLHYIFSGTTRSTVETLGRGLDTRSIGGYALLPGSTRVEGPYTVEANTTPVPIPPWMADRLAKAREKSENTDIPVIDLDKPSNIAAAASFLSSCPAAVEGEGGDALTYKTAAQVRDTFSLSESATVDLMLQYYNPRCSPPWSPEELQQKVANAHAYARHAPGESSPEYVFQEQQSAEPSVMTLAPTSADRGEISVYSIADIFDTPGKPRSWLLHSRLCKTFLTLTFAAPGVGKSGFTILEALAVASGKEVCGFPVSVKKGKVLIYNLEDSISEMRDKIVSICKALGLKKKDVAGLHLASGQDRALCLVKQDRQRTYLTKDIEYLEALITKHKYDLVILDPLAYIHQVVENDNTAMATVGRILTALAQRHNCAINVVHHSRKQNNLDIAGDMDIGRGASALTGAARIIHTLSTMSKKEALDLSIPETDRKNFIRVDEAKNNLAKAAVHELWMEKTSFMRSFGEEFMVLRPADLYRINTLREEDEAMVDSLAQAIEVGERWNITKAAKHVAHTTDVMGGSVTKIRRRLQKILLNAPVCRNKRIKYYTDKDASGTGSCWVKCLTVDGAETVLQ